MPTSESGADAWLAIAVEEYKTLREESLQAQRQHHSALQLGFSGLAVLVGLSVALHDRAVAAVVLLTAVPLLVAATTLVWLNELRRMVRAGAYLVEVEGHLNDSAAGRVPAVGWETSLRLGTGPQARLTNLYRSIFAILLGLQVLAATAGMWLLVRLDVPWLLVIVAPLEVGAALKLLDLFARAEVVLQDTGRGDYPGSTVTSPPNDLSWWRPAQSLLDTYATVRGQSLLPRAPGRAPRLSCAMLAVAGVTGRYPRWVLPEAPECVVAFAFGFQGRRDNRAPGASNYQLAHRTAEVNAGLPMMLQQEVAQALGLRDHPDTIPSTSPSGRYSDTRAVAAVMKSQMDRHGFRRALVVAHPCHVARGCAELLALGVECQPAAGLGVVAFDRKSTQPWTRRRSVWAAREIGVMVARPVQRAYRRMRSFRRSGA